MRVLYIASSGGNGGASVALYNLIKGIYQDNEVYVVFPDKGSFSDSVEKLGVRCYYINYGLCIYPQTSSLTDKLIFLFRIIKMLLEQYFAIYSLERIVDAICPDIIHTNVGPLDLGYKVAKKKKIKHVWHIREYQDLDFGLKFFPSKGLFQRMLQDNNRSIAVTKDIFKYWNLGKHDKVIYDGIGGCVLPRENCHKKKKYFLFVGRLEDAKGIKLLLKVFGQFALSNAEYSLYVAGRGTKQYFDECVSIVSEIGVEDRVLFLGHRDDVCLLMSEAIAVVVPSRFEGFGLVVTEAMYNHCLVIGRNTAGIKEQFDNAFEYIGKDVGFRFSTEEELLSVLNQLVLMPFEEQNEMANNAFNAVENKYSVKNHQSNIYSFYKKVLEI